MGHNPIPPRRRLTAIEYAREQYAIGEITLDRFEVQAAFLIEHNLDDSYQRLGSHWPPRPLRPLLRSPWGHDEDLIEVPTWQ